MKLWQKEIDIEQIIEKFTVGKDKEYDLDIAIYDVKASKAHAKMLAKIELITKDDLSSILSGLDVIEKKILANEYQIQKGVEDIHSQIELDLTTNIGETGKKIHAGRSRNDQVLVALNLYYRDTLLDLRDKQILCVDALLKRAEASKDILMPGYTHSQIGMVSSFGLWFAGYAESLIQDMNYLSAVQQLIDQNPLGSGAGYGSSFPLDRAFTSEELAYTKTAINPIFAQMTRGKSELMICQSLSAMAYTVGKFASDVCLFVGANYQFISLPDTVTTGSSIMPHKKNPDVFELIRAKCNQIAAASNQISMVTHNLMSGYHRDLQSLKEIMFPTFDLAKDVLDILNYCIPLIKVKEGLLQDPKYDYLFSVEEVNKLVLAGMPFREAYKHVSQAIETGTFSATKDINHTHLGSIGNLGIEAIKNKIL